MSAAIYRLIGVGELPVVKIGDRTLFRLGDIEALIARSVRAGDDANAPYRGPLPSALAPRHADGGAET
jgi:hypothetical protein